MIIVFPRRTAWTPKDELAFIGNPPLFRSEDQPVKVSVTFTWDIAEGKRLQKEWANYYSDVQLGGPAFGDPGGEFTPGMFLKEGVTITSRGCSNKCPFCFVPEREGEIRELNIKDGWIIQDNNLLACSISHQDNVFEMLRKQKKAIDFNGGLEARRFTDWHRQQLDTLKIHHLWFASDLPGSEIWLEEVGNLLSHYPYWKKRCYVLIGYKKETVLQAEKRLNRIYELGFLPFAMLHQEIQKRSWTKEWDALQRKWCRPAAYRSKQQINNVQPLFAGLGI
jgi:hypothetical protein